MKTGTALPQVELLWRDEHGHCRRKRLPWKRPATKEALSEYVEDYIELVAEGYRPQGFREPPLPHCARVLLNGNVLAEWLLKKKPAVDTDEKAWWLGKPSEILGA